MNVVREQTGPAPRVRGILKEMIKWLVSDGVARGVVRCVLKVAMWVSHSLGWGQTKLGDIAYRLGFKEEAISCFDRILRMNENSLEARKRLGDVFLDVGRFNEGISSWETVARHQSTDAYKSIYERSLKLLHQGRWDAMIDLLTMASEVQEEFAERHRINQIGVRFLREWSFAIGHIALLDFYVKMGILGLRLPGRPVIVDPTPANECYLNYWRRYLPDIITDSAGVQSLLPVAERLEEHLHVVSFADGSKMNHVAASVEVQRQWEEGGREHLLALTQEDFERGWQCLESLGVHRDGWFVSLHVRDTDSGNGRDASIEDYRAAMRVIVERGGTVVRMGNPSMPAITSMPGVIDYVHSEVRCDWMDVFLWGACRFFVGTQSGPAYVPPTFGIPCVLTNLFPMVRPLPYGRDIGIYKLHRSESKNRYLTFNEVFNSPAGMSETIYSRNDSDVSLVSNTPEEISDAVQEMIDCLDGIVVTTEEDERLQACFKKLKPPIRNSLGVSNGRVGSAFLKKYSHLLA